MTELSVHRPLPLSGLRVLDLTRALSGPFCTMILGDLGADVVKVEPIPGGDMIRSWGPFDHGISTYYLSANRNKRSIAVDFRHAEALGILKELAGESDVLVENFKPGTMEAIGLDYARLAPSYPRLIYAGITGFGRTGPAALWPGFDQVAQGYSGMMSITGMPESGPTRIGVAIGDLTAGMWAAMGVLAALHERTTNGRGQMVETSLLASLVSLLSAQGQRFLSLKEVPGLTGNTHPTISPYGVFMTSDGPLIIAAATSGMWQKLCSLLELEELVSHPDFIDHTLRRKNREQLKAILEAKLRRGTRQEWSNKLLAAGVPAGPINDLAAVFSDPHVQHCGLVDEIAHPVIGGLKQLSNPIQMSSTFGGSNSRPPPQLGEHTCAVLLEYGISESRIQRLLYDGVVEQHE